MLMTCHVVKKKSMYKYIYTHKHTHTCNSKIVFNSEPWWHFQSAVSLGDVGTSKSYLSQVSQNFRKFHKSQKFTFWHNYEYSVWLDLIWIFIIERKTRNLN